MHTEHAEGSKSVSLQCSSVPYSTRLIRSVTSSSYERSKITYKMQYVSISNISAFIQINFSLSSHKAPNLSVASIIKNNFFCSLVLFFLISLCSNFILRSKKTWRNFLKILLRKNLSFLVSQMVFAPA